MRPNASWVQVLPWISTYAIAMAFLESAVVVYLRELYYPVEFRFPIAPITSRIATTELLREVATLVMLLAPGALLSRRRNERFAWFCFCFGVWDIFYYVFLKAILDWPASLLDWDILFLVPVVWVGPVLAPCLVSIGLIAFACLLLHKRERSADFAPRKWHWLALAISGAIILYTFIEEPCRHVLHGGGQPSSLPAAGNMALDQLRTYIPEHFSWILFALAAALAAATLMDLARRKA